jgi:hypothetical protein
MSVYNVATCFVGLVEAETPKDAERIFRAYVEHRAAVSAIDDYDVSPPFESEPIDADTTVIREVPTMGARWFTTDAASAPR